jgi:hypothetical protein
MRPTNGTEAGPVQRSRYEAPLEPPPRHHTGNTIAVIAFALGGVLILALGLWLGSRTPAPAIPQLTLVEPSAGAVLSQPVELIFDVHNARIRIGPGGWGYGTMHVHAYVGSLEIMPGPDDIEFIASPSRYRWTLPALAPGEHEVRIGWSDLYHLPVEEGGSERVRVTVR